METHSQTSDTPHSRQVLEGHLRECYGRVVYTHKTHEKCCDLLLAKWSRIKVWQIILSAATTAGFLSVAFGTGTAGAIFGAAVSTTLLALNAYTKNYDLGELAQKHKQAANTLWVIREKYLALITDLVMGEKPIEKLQEERDALTKQLGAAYASAPATNSAGYKKAQEALKFNEDLTFSDKEIDAFLPKELRRTYKDQNQLPSGES
jgi:hypothetical protein